MKFLNILIVLILLTSCAKTETVTGSLLGTTSIMVDTLESSVPEECKTEEYRLAISSIKSQIKSVEDSHKQEIEICETETDKWKGYFFFSIAILVSILIRKLWR